MKIDFCLPAYNEEKIIGQSLRELLNFLDMKNYPVGWEVIVINNGSNDRTKEIVGGFINPRVRLVEISERGKGNAIKLYWTKSQADILVFMDCDLAVALRNIDDLLSPFLNGEETDLVIGSRMMPGSIIERSFLRELNSRACNILYRLIIGYPISDTQCGFKAIRSDSFRKISHLISAPDFFFDSELITFSITYGMRLKEIPVEWKEERYENRKSKIKVFRDGWTHFKNLLKLKRKINVLAIPKS